MKRNALRDGWHELSDYNAAFRTERGVPVEGLNRMGDFTDRVISAIERCSGYWLEGFAYDGEKFRMRPRRSQPTHAFYVAPRYSDPFVLPVKILGTKAYSSEEWRFRESWGHKASHNLINGQWVERNTQRCPTKIVEYT